MRTSLPGKNLSTIVNASFNLIERLRESFAPAVSLAIPIASAISCIDTPFLAISARRLGYAILSLALRDYCDILFVLIMEV